MLFAKDLYVLCAFIAAALNEIHGEFHCFKRFRPVKKTCGGLIRHKVSGPEVCCSDNGQGFTRQGLDFLGKNTYSCESCEEWENTRIPTTTPKAEFVCFRKYRTKRQQCGGPIRREKASTLEECCSGPGNGFWTLGLIRRGRNRYTCSSCEEWKQSQTTTTQPTTTPEVLAEWGDWSRCSVTCGSGVQTRHRECQNCDLSDPDNFETKYCLVHYYCPEDGNWGSWQPWEECSQSCEGGVRRRERFCDSPPPKHGGNDCIGDRSQEESCNNRACAVDGNWGPWSRFGECSETCGRGEMTRRRQCNSPPPFGDGQPCRGRSIETRRCELRKCPIHGGWSNWNNWSDCSGSCGAGERTRTRRCDSPNPRFGGRSCEGSAEETDICQNSIPCPVHGGWSEWSSYGLCRAEPCSEGHRLRVRECDNPRPKNRGRMCRGRSVEKIPCKNTEGCPVDGQWCGFGLWSACSSTCVGVSGTQTRRRSCYCPPPQHGGKLCEGNSEETRQCKGFNFCDDGVIGVDRQR